MARKAGGDGALVVGSNKLKDWKGSLPLRVHKMIAAYTAHYNQKNNLTGDNAVTEGDVVASIATETFGRDAEFMKKFEAGELDGAAGDAGGDAGKKGGK